jgi:hypothetical protein
MDRPESDTSIRFITESDIRHFFGMNTPNSLVGWAVDYHGKLAAIAGVIYTRPLPVVFSYIDPDVKAPDITVWRCAIKIWQNIKGLGHPSLYAVADDGLVTAPRFLTRLGFRLLENDARGEVYIWETQ